MRVNTEYYFHLKTIIKYYYNTKNINLGFFKKNNQMHYGTNNICSQIVNNTIIDFKVSNILNEHSIKKFDNYLLYNLTYELINFDHLKKQDLLLFK